MAGRIQSPSSINSYKRCPRKYYYEYILKLKLAKSIHLVRGSITHSALEDFFKLDISVINQEHYEFELNILLNNLFKKHWESSKKELDELNLERKELEFYYRETVAMIDNWFRAFIRRLDKEMNGSKTLEDAFKLLTPQTEALLISERHRVRGYLDTIYNKPEGVFIIDYKTSKRPEITEEYKLQLAIYALLYNEKHGHPPKKVGIDFLRHGIQFLNVDEQLMKFAEEECKIIQEKTQTNNIDDYPKTPSMLCRKGYCSCKDFERMIQQRSLTDFTNKE